MLISFPGVAKSDLGLGYNFFEAKITGPPFDPATIPPLPPPTSGQSTNFFAQLVEDSASLRKVLDISAQAEFGFGAFSGNMSAGFASELEVNSYSLFMVGKVTVELEKRGFTAQDWAKLRIASDILEWFKGPDDLGEFRSRFGDYFSTGVVQGGVLFFVVEIETNSRKDKSDAMLSVGGSSASWKASATFKQSIETLQKGRRITAQVAQSGGDWSFKEIDADALFNMALNFPNTVANSPVTLALDVEEYDSVQNWPGSITNYTPLLQLSESVRQFQEWHSAFLDTLSDIDFISEHLIAFADTDDKKLAGLRSQVKRADEELCEGLVKLAGDPLKNQNLVPSLIVADPATFRAQLPEWRNVTARITHVAFQVDDQGGGADYREFAFDTAVQGPDYVVTITYPGSGPDIINLRNSQPTASIPSSSARVKPYGQLTLSYTTGSTALIQFTGSLFTMHTLNMQNVVVGAIDYL
jgi:hypothetical protein